MLGGWQLRVRDGRQLRVLMILGDRLQAADADRGVLGEGGATHDVHDRHGEVWVCEKPEHRHGCPCYLRPHSSLIQSRGAS